MILLKTERLRQARTADFPAIESWRETHFARMRERQAVKRAPCEQATLSVACWVVYVDARDVPLAAMGFRDEPPRAIRWATDLYAAPTKAGLRAGLALVRLLGEMSDRDGYTVIGETDPENIEYLEHVVKHGYAVSLVQFRREPRAV